MELQFIQCHDQGTKDWSLHSEKICGVTVLPCRPICLCSAQHFLRAPTPSVFLFSLFSTPLKLCSPSLQPFSLLCVSHCYPPSPVHTQPMPTRSNTHSAPSCYPRSCHFSQSPIHINRPQWASSYPSICHHPPPPSPFSAFGITILSESFIYPLSSFIPFAIISASLSSMNHSSIRCLPALFFAISTLADYLPFSCPSLPIFSCHH